MRDKVLAYGGGVNSTALLIKYENQIKEAVFVDHGGDYPYTYNYVNYMVKQGFPITVIKPAVNYPKEDKVYDNLPDYYEAKRCFPNRRFRDCTDKFKLTPQKRYFKGQNIKMFIGFSAGEEKRVKSEFRLSKGITAHYPLISDGVTRDDCHKIIADAGLKPVKRSACWLCFNCSKDECKIMAVDYPELWERRKRMKTESLRNSAERHYNVLPNWVEKREE